ncbi:MAG: hypothetical protein ACJ796_14370 [Gemmatimonadaceae bacterium]
MGSRRSGSGQKPFLGETLSEASSLDAPSDSGDEEEQRAPTGGTLRIPSVEDFTPKQVSLIASLEIAALHAGDADAQRQAIRHRFFAAAGGQRRDDSERLEQQLKRAYNVQVGMRHLGLLDATTHRLTPLGEELLAEPEKEIRDAKFASFILRERQGLRVLHAVMSLQERGEEVTKLSLRDELVTFFGYSLSDTSAHHTKLLQWLREAGVVDKDNVINVDLVKDLTGVSLSTVSEWADLEYAQKCLLRTLRRKSIATQGTPLLAKTVRKETVSEFGQVFRKADQMAAHVYRPLQRAGWVTYSGGGGEEGSGGHGGSSGYLAPTAKLLDTDFELLTRYPAIEISADTRRHLNTPLDQIYREIQSDDTRRKGIALEVLALRMALDLALFPRRLRARNERIVGEIDLIAEGVHLHFSRWLFQCKALAPRGSLALSDLAKEVGMAVLTRAHVIVMATTGHIPRSVRSFANELAENGVLQVVLVGKEVLDGYKRNGGALLEFFHSQASATMRRKQPQVESVVRVATEENRD